MRPFLCALLLVVSACGSSRPPCNAQTCAVGCCDGTGVCLAGDSASACGQRGAACMSCGALGTCVAGACQQIPGGTGGGSGTGGGEAGGGAMAGGVAGGSAGGTAGGAAMAGGAAGGMTAGGSAGGAVDGGSGGGTPDAGPSLKPEVLLLVDKSGSMNGVVVPGCMGATCATRIGELKAAMTTFLSASTAPNRLGLAFFPEEDPSFSLPVCAPTRSIAVSLPPRTVVDSNTQVLNDVARVINDRIQALGTDGGAPVVGGTPTGASLRFIRSAPGLFDTSDQRRDVVVLLTDGVPNCNLSNPLSCNATPLPPSDRCTLNPAPNPSMLNNCNSTFCSAGYLDADGTVQALTELRTLGISTLVIGFGADFASTLATDTLNAMATAGGLPRRCPNGTNTECGSGNTCLSTRLCSRQFYGAANGAELSLVLANLPALVGP